MTEDVLLSVFDGVPQSEISASLLDNGVSLVDLVAEATTIFGSKGEARRMLKDGGIQLNKEKMSDDILVSRNHLLNNKYILIQKGKKNYYLLLVK